MTKIVDLQFNNSTYYSAPTFNGVGDTNAIRTGVAEGATTYIPLGLGGRFTGMGNMTLINDSNRVTRQLSLLEGSGVAPTNPYFDIWLNNNPTDVGSNLSTGALRALINFPQPVGANATIVAGYQTGTQRWQLSGYAGGWGFQGLANGNGGNPYGIYRVEIQWDTSQTNWIVGRLYSGNGTTQVGTVVPAPTGTAYGINVLRFGDLNGIVNGQTWQYAEIEAWNTRDGDGTFSNTWTSGSGGVMNSSYAGGRRTTTYSIPGTFSTPQDSVVVAAGTKTFTNQSYGQYGRDLNLYIPNGTPASSSGYPLVIWAHSGFGVAGLKTDMIAHWRDRLLNAGYAVASIRYLRSVATSAVYSAYGTSNADSGNVTAYGRYPSFIVDYKLAAVRLRDKMSQTGTSPLLNDNGYGFNGSLLFASGYSFGGGMALGAALTRDLTDDGASNRNLTIAGNTAYRVIEDGTTAYTGADPTFVGAYVYGAPVSMGTALTRDWSHNNTNAILWPPMYPSGAPTTQANSGTVHIASRAFMGTAVTASNPSGASFSETDISSLIAAQHAANPSKLNVPVKYIRGTADYLLDSTQEALLAAAVSGTAITYSTATTPANHDLLDEVYNFADLQSFLDTIVVNNTPSTSSLVPLFGERGDSEMSRSRSEDRERS